MAVSESAADRLWGVYQSGGTCCAYCGRALRVHEAHTEEERSQTRTICGECRSDKGARSGAEYRHLRRMRLAQQMLGGLSRA